eukprot:GEMP01085642.1.p1 GENE.GEMP01085642.1~~GEMP01085642.1.p1  ORF type:complete len:219 (+),score=40.03 GEMP01085642.1:64-720(+)
MPNKLKEHTHCFNTLLVTYQHETFRQAIEQVFANWTVLNLAIDFGWGGRDGVAKRKLFLDEFMEMLMKPGKQWKDDDCRDTVADFLTARASELFNCDIEDDSDLAIAGVSLQLLSECKQGNLTFAQEIIASGNKAAKTSQCQAVRGYEYVDDNALPGDQRPMDCHGGVGVTDGFMSDSDSEQDEDDNPNIQMQPEEPNAKLEPEVDEDGFVTVSRKRK